MPIKRKYILTPKKQKFIRDNYLKLTDEAIAGILHVPRTTITKWRIEQLGLVKNGTQQKVTDKQLIKAPSKKQNVKRMSEEERRSFYLQQLRRRPRYQLMKQGLSPEELQMYEEKYIEWFSNPDIETIQAHEEDDLHELTMLQINILRLRKEEYESRIGGNQIVNNSKAIKEATELIIKFKNSLDIERRQRLKRQEDSATNFTTLIRELNDNNIRPIAGCEATMLKFRMEESINALIENGLVNGILQQDLSQNFVSGEMPSNYKPPELQVRTEKGVEDDGTAVHSD